MRSFWIRVGPKSSEGVLIRDGRGEDEQSHREEGHGQEAGAHVIDVPAKKRQEL